MVVDDGAGGMYELVEGGSDIDVTVRNHQTSLTDQYPLFSITLTQDKTHGTHSTIPPWSRHMIIYPTYTVVCDGCDECV